MLELLVVGYSWNDHQLTFVNIFFRSGSTKKTAVDGTKKSPFTKETSPRRRLPETERPVSEDSKLRELISRRPKWLSGDFSVVFFEKNGKVWQVHLQSHWVYFTDASPRDLSAMNLCLVPLVHVYMSYSNRGFSNSKIFIITWCGRPTMIGGCFSRKCQRLSRRQRFLRLGLKRTGLSFKKRCGSKSTAPEVHFRTRSR